MIDPKRTSVSDFFYFPHLLLCDICYRDVGGGGPDQFQPAS